MMSEEREFEGKDLEEALEAASSSLGIPEADLHYEMVEQGRRGVLGLGAKSVRIRVMPPVEALPDSAIRDTAEEEPAPEPPQKTGSKRRGARGPQAKPKVKSEAPAEACREVETTVKRMLELMGLQLEAQLESADGGVSLQLQGADEKMLLAKNAELLLALQLLLNRMSRRAWPQVGRIQIYCNGEGRRRDDEIVELAREVAQQVSHTGRTKKLQPLNAYERRLVHIAVRDFPGLSSSSDGQGPLKRVRISKVRNELES